MKNHDFQKLVDQNLSGLLWDERKRRRVLQAIGKEERNMKKSFMTFVLIAAVLCLSVTAFAAELIFSGRVDAVRLAEKALEDAYGVTTAMQCTFFQRTVEQQDDGSVRVIYSGSEDLHEVLGDYTVTVEYGKASAVWNHDGEDTSGMFEAEAWGVEQLKEMLRLCAEDHEMTAFYQQAVAVAKRRGVPSFTAVFARSEEDQAGEEAVRAAAKAAGRTEEDLLCLAKEAVATAYELKREQCALLVDPCGAGLSSEEAADGYMYYHAQGGKLIYTVMISLHQRTSDDPDAFPPFTEKDGVYWVDVNVETGVIENILYDTQLNGNG